jgi:hypothetical protein
MKSRFKIIIDKKEQKPYSFPEWIETARESLKTGDYAVYGDDNFAVERKSLNDFIGTISSGWARFCRELKRMEDADYPAKIIMIEADFEEICFKKFEDEIKAPEHDHVDITPQFIIKRIAELSLRGAIVIFAGNRQYAMALTLIILQQRYKKLG